MTWSEVYKTAKKLTMQDGGVQFTGFQNRLMSNTLLDNPYSLELVDPATNRATFENGSWKRMFEQMLPVYGIPGNSYLNGTDVMNKFVKEKSLAMMVSLNSDYAGLTDLNWNVVSLPAFEGVPGISAAPEPVFYVVSANGGHQAEAFQVIAHMTSAAVQTEKAKEGSAPVLREGNVREAFGTGDGRLTGKNTKGLLPEKMAAPVTINTYSTAVYGFLSTAFADAAGGRKDLNTALRDATEQANKKIEELEATDKIK
ncbi:MAG: hypothetical protein K0R28_16 [Paenibacillus sp.]|jgi:multiple sugar transport system substrate-binding protein|nr:hypothetical protein [Paenibacillus sp.]